MSDNQGYIKARLKTQERLAEVYPGAEYWGKPLPPGYYFRAADEVILPFLGKTIWVKKVRRDRYEFHYEIKDTGGLIVLSDWIEFFDSEDLVPPAKWDDPYQEVHFDTNFDHLEERFLMVEGLLVIMA